MSNPRWLFTMALVLALLPAGLRAQVRGSVTGVVTDAATLRPLVGVQVQIAGTQIGTITNQQGRYLILNVPAGDREVRVVMMGYSQATQLVSVAADATVTADFAIRETAITLEGLIVTATGGTQRRREVGDVVGDLSVADVEMAAVSSVAQLLTARSPGVTVISSSGTTGSSQRIRIRSSTLGSGDFVGF